MTTIAYRDGVLAADTQATAGQSHRGHHVVKIAKRGPILAAGAGNATAAIRFMDWFRSGMAGDPPSLGDKDNSAEGYLFMPGGPILRITINGWEKFDADYEAIGAGADYAYGAMAMGATAEQAVLASIKHECFSGGEITVLRHD